MIFRGINIPTLTSSYQTLASAPTACVTCGPTPISINPLDRKVDYWLALLTARTILLNLCLPCIHQSFLSLYFWALHFPWATPPETHNSNTCISWEQVSGHAWKFTLDIRGYCVTMFFLVQAKRYPAAERHCEAAEGCSGLHGLEMKKCIRICISKPCYDELYAWDEVRTFSF